MKTQTENKIETKFVITYKKNTNREPFISNDGGDTEDIENAQLFSEEEANEYIKDHDGYPSKMEVNVDENDNIIQDED